MISLSQREQTSAMAVRKKALFIERLRRFLERLAYGIRKRTRKPRCQRINQQEWPVDKPLVSVIIPCYNYGRFVQEAIESVLAQTFQRFEVIVIDDGSTDELTKRILKNLSYHKTRVIEQDNHGLAETRNIGAGLAVGKYICFLDADDSIEPTYLEETLSVLESDESLGSCFSWVRCFGEMNSIWQTADLDPFRLRHSTTASSNGVIRKRAWEDVRRQNGFGFLTKYNGYFEDWVFWIDMLQCGYRGRVIKKPLIRYRIHKSSLGATHKPGFDRMLEILREDKRQFFYDRSYSKQLENNLNLRIYVENNRINLC
jgi:glycosyltransferase involved in cell wall biosynthesis